MSADLPAIGEWVVALGHCGQPDPLQDGDDEHTVHGLVLGRVCAHIDQDAERSISRRPCARRGPYRLMVEARVGDECLVEDFPADIAGGLSAVPDWARGSEFVFCCEWRPATPAELASAQLDLEASL